MNNISILDCSLRDGGYLNDWNFNYDIIRSIFKGLVKANVDIVEVGFLRDIDEYDENKTISNTIENLNNLLPSHLGNTKFCAMAMRSNYDIKQLSDYSGDGIEIIRVTAHDYDILEGLEFAKEVQEKGYKVSINPINIMGYSDKEIIGILEKVEKIHPYQFSIVDTFGSMKRKDLDRITALADNNLSNDIRLGLHLHENMSLAHFLAQTYIDKKINRPITIDGSLMGIGRVPGNLPIELIADYINDFYSGNYNINYLLDLIQDFITPLRKQYIWGYTPVYFLSAKFNLHRNYAEYYSSFGDLTNRDIYNIFSKFDNGKKTVYDKKYADEMYLEYKNNIIDDSNDIKKIKELFIKRPILILAPGKSIIEEESKINGYIQENNPIVIALNFIPDKYTADYVFFTNDKRYQQFFNSNIKTIITSNIRNVDANYRVNYLTSTFKNVNVYSGLLNILNLLEKINIRSVTVAGADGYDNNGINYYNPNISNYEIRDSKFNNIIANEIKNIQIEIKYLTKSKYDI